MKRHMDNARRGLGELHGLARRTEESEQRILASATRRREEVHAAIERQRAGIEAAPAKAQQRYLDLVAERGQLDQVIAKSRKAING